MLFDIFFPSSKLFNIKFLISLQISRQHFEKLYFDYRPTPTILWKSDFALIINWTSGLVKNTFLYLLEFTFRRNSYVYATPLVLRLLEISVPILKSFTNVKKHLAISLLSNYLLFTVLYYIICFYIHIIGYFAPTTYLFCIIIFLSTWRST
jgi:hypothetical protein